MNSPQEELIYWAAEREKIRVNKEAGRPKPWTQDPILRDYKFCNVQRNDDRVSKWIQEKWLFPNRDHHNVAFGMCVARHINWPLTLDIIGFPFVWEPEVVRRRMKTYRDAGNKVYTGAYMISTNGVSMDKIDYSIDRVLTPLFDKMRAPSPSDSIRSYCEYLQNFNGFSSFMAGQVIADLKYIPPLMYAKDWNTWTPLGPGSIRGLNRYYGRSLNCSIPPMKGVQELIEIQERLKKELGWEIALHDVQNVCCEYDKYMRLKYDGGKVRSKYNGAK